MGTTEQGESDGGDIIFIPGLGYKETIPPGRDGRIIFKLADGTEAMRFEPSGRVFVFGALVTHDFSVYEGFKTWLVNARIIREDDGADEEDV